MTPDTPSSNDDSYVTVAELAAHLRVTRTVIYTAIHGGEIEDVIRVGKRGFRIPDWSARVYVAGLKLSSDAAPRPGPLLVP